MQLIDQTTINKFQLPEGNVITLVFLNGELHSSYNNLQTVTYKDNSLTIAANSNVEPLIHLLFFTTTTCSNELTVKVNNSSSATLIEEYVTLAANGYQHKVMRNYHIADNSKLIIYKLQNESLTAVHNATVNVTQSANSTVTTNFIGKGAKLIEEYWRVKFTDTNAGFTTYGLCQLHDQQNFNYHTRIEHAVANCKSSVIFKGIVDDQAVGSFSGRVIVAPNAAKSEAHMTNKNLLLAETATMQTAPELEIYADDVICTHGATVGQLDQEALFYLRSRGLPPALAQQLLLKAFVGEIVEQFAEPIKKRLRDNDYMLQ